MKIHLGETAGGKPLNIDLEALMETRLLIQANSGGGKSYLLRRLAEQAFGKLPIIIIDPEGEFASLREKYGFVLVGEGGETPADVRSAGLVGETLLKLQASAVCDLHEAFRKNPIGRQQWVKSFLESFIDAPKSYWRDTLIIIDEAQIFCPQDGDSACHDAMVGLNTVGRKRGFCPIWATQRLALIDKDASSQLLNRIIGMTFEDVDVKRAINLLSVAGEDVKSFSQTIRTLNQGDFFAFGRAISRERIQFHCGVVETTHPKRGGKRQLGPPPAPEAVKAMLPKLADLPKHADEKAKSEADLRREIGELKRKLKEAPIKAETKTIERFALKDGQLARAEKLFERMAGIATDALNAAKEISEAIKQTRQPMPAQARAVVRQPQQPRPIIHRPQSPRQNVDAPMTVGGGGLRRILIALAQRPGLTDSQIGVRAGLSSSSGTFGTYMSSARVNGWIVDDSGRRSITEDGLHALGEFNPLPSGSELLRYWLGKLGNSGAARILQAAADSYPNELSYEQAGEQAMISHTSGTFGTYLSTLRTLELIQGKGVIKASDELFD